MDCILIVSYCIILYHSIPVTTAAAASGKHPPTRRSENEHILKRFVKGNRPFGDGCGSVARRRGAVRRGDAVASPRHVCGVFAPSPRFRGRSSGGSERGVAHETEIRVSF